MGVLPGVQQQILIILLKRVRGVLDFLLIPKAYVFEFDFSFHLTFAPGEWGGVFWYTLQP